MYKRQLCACDDFILQDTYHFPCFELFVGHHSFIRFRHMNCPPVYSSTYPPYTNENPSLSTVIPQGGIVVPTGNPLTIQSVVIHPSSQYVNSPSYKSIREELGEEMNRLTRKDRRKLLKNKRNRIKRKVLTQLQCSLDRNVNQLGVLVTVSKKRKSMKISSLNTKRKNGSGKRGIK